MAATGVDAASAQIIATSRLYKTVAPGGTVRMDAYMAVDPLCHSMGLAEVSLLRAPAGGRIALRRGSSFPAYYPNNARSKCNSRQVPATVIFYEASSSFVGNDTFDVEVVFPEGLARKYRYIVVVH